MFERPRCTQCGRFISDKDLEVCHQENKYSGGIIPEIEYTYCWCLKCVKVKPKEEPNE